MEWGVGKGGGGAGTHCVPDKPTFGCCALALTPESPTTPMAMPAVTMRPSYCFEHTTRFEPNTRRQKEAKGSDDVWKTRKKIEVRD